MNEPFADGDPDSDPDTDPVNSRLGGGHSVLRLGRFVSRFISGPISDVLFLRRGGAAGASKVFLLDLVDIETLRVCKHLPDRLVEVE